MTYFGLEAKFDRASDRASYDVEASTAASSTVVFEESFPTSSASGRAKITRSSHSYSAATLSLAATTIGLFVIACGILVYGVSSNEKWASALSAALFVVFSFVALKWIERAKGEYDQFTGVSN